MRDWAVMAPHVKDVVALDPYVVRVTLVDGEVRDIDIEPLLDGPVFGGLREPAAFRQVRVDEFQQTICWPGDVDLDPDVIYGNLRPA